MKIWIAAALLLCLPAIALAQEGDDPGATTPPETLLPAAEPEPPPPAAQRLSLTGAPGHRDLEHSDGRLQLGEYFASLGVHLGMTAVFLAVEVLGLALYLDEYGHHASELNAYTLVSAIVAPLIMNLPSSLVAYKVSKRCGAYDHSWLFTYVSGVAVTALSLGAAALLMGSGSADWQVFVITSFILGTLLAPAAQVLVLNLTRKPAPVLVAPLLIPGGGGLAVGQRF